jgi:DNA-binding PadR family transcriptional regulator
MARALTGPGGYTRRLSRAERRVLAALLTGAPNLHGYTLMRVAQVGAGRLYGFLNQLEAEGWADGTWGPETAGGHRRRAWHLTRRGQYRGRAALGLEHPGDRD